MYIYTYKHTNFKSDLLEAGEMVQDLRALAAPLEDVSSVLSTHNGSSQLSTAPVPRIYPSGIHVVHTSVHAGKTPYK